MASARRFSSVLLLIILVWIQRSEHRKGPIPRKGLRSWWFTTDPEYIQFFLFPNPDDEDYAEEIFLDDELSLKESQFNPGKPVIILIHGLLGNSHILTDVQLLKNAYLSIQYSANIIIVDYGELAGTRIPFPVIISPLNGVLSLAASRNTEIVAERIAAFVHFLKNTGAISSPKNIHLIGHSMGCHVAGRVGHIVGLNMQSKIKRISGLDCPPGQLYTNYLHKEDAFFVDVTHTSYYGVGAGISRRLGHVDFFVNGAGISQPNCPNIFPFTDPFCRHASSVFYFAKSIRNKNIYGCHCEVCLAKPVADDCTYRARYGQFVSKKTRGGYYVTIPQFGYEE